MSAIFAAVAQEAGLSFLSDEPIWYLHPDTISALAQRVQRRS
jgi:hypothetical protein